VKAAPRGYLHANTPAAPELARLRLLEARYDAVTRDRLARAGDLTGTRCLEVGAGAGSVTRMLSELAGPTGQVMAFDLDPRFLTDLNLDNVTVRRHDILTDDLEQHGYDLVHCRALLLHLPDPKRALHRMAAALRPGGMLLAEDTDFATMAACPGHPAAPYFDRLTRAWVEGFDPSGRFDPGFGRNLPALLDELGLVDRGSEALEFRRRGGGPEAELFAHGFELARDGIVSAEFPPDTDIELVIAALRDPEFFFVDSLNIGCWGRRPRIGYLG
jgi:SAM-dependent methyltransferase